MSVLLRGDTIVKSYGSTPALRDVSVEVAEGEILAVTGPSGCGKSTLLHCLAGILRPDSGAVVYRDRDITTWTEASRSQLRRSEFGVLFQFGQLVAELTAAENVALPLLLAGTGRRAARKAALSWLERFGVAETADRRPGELSGGQQQRCAVARALITEPKVLFADEPTGALDTLAGEQVLTQIIRVVRELGTAVVLVTHEARVTVAAVPELGDSDGGSVSWSRQYAHGLLVQPGLRPGVVIALLLLAIPVLALVGQCIRFGAPARDRRLAALRLAGAGPGQTVLVAAAETAAAALLGSAIGVAAYLVGRQALHRPDERGLLPLPTDVRLSPVVFVAVLVLVPVLAGLVGSVLLRRIVVTPLGVVRRVRTRPPRLWPGVLIIAGVVTPVVVRPFGRLVARWTGDWPQEVRTAALVIGVLLIVLGVVVGTGWITHTTGRILHRFARRPAMLLAGRQLIADPWAGSRRSRRCSQG